MLAPARAQRRSDATLVGLTLVFSLNYLYGGPRLLRWRQRWIAERVAQERLEE